MEWQTAFFLAMGAFIWLYALYTVYNLSNFLGDYFRNRS